MLTLSPAAALRSLLSLSLSLCVCLPQSYQNEVQLLTALEHPGIVSHIESFIDGDKQHMCIVMSYCEGGDLAAYLKHKKGVAMSETEICYHFVQMALALLFMHEKNILHRDLKTQNIFVRNGLMQLGDFGISKELTASTDFAQTCIGTPYVRRQTKPARNEKTHAAANLCVWDLNEAQPANALTLLFCMRAAVHVAGVVSKQTLQSQERRVVRGSLCTSMHDRRGIRPALCVPHKSLSLFLTLPSCSFCSLSLSHCALQGAGLCFV